MKLWKIDEPGVVNCLMLGAPLLGKVVQMPPSFLVADIDNFNNEHLQKNFVSP